MEGIETIIDSLVFDNKKNNLHTLGTIGTKDKEQFERLNNYNKFFNLEFKKLNKRSQQIPRKIADCMEKAAKKAKLKESDLSLISELYDNQDNIPIVVAD